MRVPNGRGGSSARGEGHRSAWPSMRSDSVRLPARVNVLSGKGPSNVRPRREEVRARAETCEKRVGRSKRRRVGTQRRDEVSAPQKASRAVRQLRGVQRAEGGAEDGRAVLGFARGRQCSRVAFGYARGRQCSRVALGCDHNAAMRPWGVIRMQPCGLGNAAMRPWGSLAGAAHADDHRVAVEVDVAAEEGEGLLARRRREGIARLHLRDAREGEGPRDLGGLEGHLRAAKAQRLGWSGRRWRRRRR
eukprot:7386132-Prymnesium_polylepis.1